jgi:hypothetical protein
MTILPVEQKGLTTFLGLTKNYAQRTNRFIIDSMDRALNERFVIRDTSLISTTNCSDGTNGYGFHIPWPTHEMILTDHDG